MLTSGKKIAILNVKVVFCLLIQCSRTMIASYLTSIAPIVAMHGETEAKMVAQYSKHQCQVMWEIFKLT